MYIDLKTFVSSNIHTWVISQFQLKSLETCLKYLDNLLIFSGWHGQTALHKACLCGDWSVTYLLLEGGADPNAKNEFDETPVHYSCKRGLAQIVHLMVQRGGNLEAVDKNGKSAAHHAAQTGSV